MFSECILNIILSFLLGEYGEVFLKVFLAAGWS